MISGLPLLFCVPASTIFSISSMSDPDLVTAALQAFSLTETTFSECS